MQKSSVYLYISSEQSETKSFLKKYHLQACYSCTAGSASVSKIPFTAVQSKYLCINLTKHDAGSVY